MTDSHRNTARSAVQAATVKSTRNVKSPSALSAQQSNVFEDVGFFHEAHTHEVIHETISPQELHAANPFARLRYLIERIIGNLKEDLRVRFNLTKNQVYYFEVDASYIAPNGYPRVRQEYADNKTFDLILDNLVHRRHITNKWKSYYATRHQNLVKALAEIMAMQDLYLEQSEHYEVAVSRVREVIADVGGRFPNVKKALKQVDLISPSRLINDIKFLDEQIALRQCPVSATAQTVQEQNAIDVLKRERLNNEIQLLRLQRYFAPDEKKQSEAELAIHNKKIEHAHLQIKIAVTETKQVENDVQIMLEEFHLAEKNARTKLVKLIEQDKKHVWADLVEPLFNVIDNLKHIPDGLKGNFAIHGKDSRPINQGNFGVSKPATLTYLRSLVKLHNAIQVWLQANKPGFFANLFGSYTPQYAEMLALSKKMYGLIEKQKTSDYYNYLRAGIEMLPERIVFKKPEFVRCQDEIDRAQYKLNREQERLLNPLRHSLAYKKQQLEQLQTQVSSPRSVGSESSNTSPCVAL